MGRYFLEISYHGAEYAGFQIQKNARTVQEELEKAMFTYFRFRPELTGSSRTDAGVHARQNFFHFDTEVAIDPRAMYNLNSILPGNISVQGIYPVRPEAHCRFDAISRSYVYTIYTKKDPFLRDRAYFYPYALDFSVLQEAAGLIATNTDFTGFSKRNTQVFTYNCTIMRSEWCRKGDILEYRVEANRFLRGMVRGLVATMLRVGRGKSDCGELARLLAAKDSSKAWFDAPGHGLMLDQVRFEWEKLVLEAK
ncbi:MAG: tRNA pseudouridine(38-40) synthase TruA [Chitinophagaceae bacterium]|nr:MAG: tRNA pseudouridine(38-40) synthase TruA [Chitinophagaceae bacterium]